MSMTKRSNETEAYILGALERLLKKKAFAEISITELAKTAGVSRMTFYRYYQNPTEILTHEMSRIMTELTTKVDFDAMIPHEGLVYIMRFLKVNGDFIKVLVAANEQDMLRDSIAKTLVQLSHHKGQLQDLNSREIAYYARYHSTGLTSVIVDWITKAGPETPEELATFLERIGEGAET